MADYIDRQETIKELQKRLVEEHKCGFAFIDSDFIAFLNDMPTEDVAPVVRCSQCRKRYTTECALWFSQLDDKQYFCGAIHNDDFYCSCGERKD